MCENLKLFEKLGLLAFPILGVITKKMCELKKKCFIQCYLGPIINLWSGCSMKGSEKKCF